MDAPYFERLTSLDHTFLVFEGPRTPMHVAATAILDPGQFRNEKGGIDREQVKRYVASRLHLTPEYRRRLEHIPIENHPVWVDDQTFDIDYHIRHSSLPRPGTRVQLQELCARLLERPLDRTRPLWEIWVIEGLEDGRFALLMKIHHCLVDGVAGVSLMAALFGVAPETTISEPIPWQPRPVPSSRDLLRSELKRRADMSSTAARRLSEGLRDPAGSARQISKKLGGALSFLSSGWRATTSTPFGAETSMHRRMRWLTLDLSEVKEVKTSLKGTINDVVLTTVAGGVRRYLRRRGVAMPPGSFRVAVPVNVRAGDQREQRGNHVWMWLLPLPVEVTDARTRFAHVHDDAEELKHSEQAAVGDLVTQAFEWTSANLLPLGIDLVRRAQAFDILVTNVPGPPLRLFMLDAEITELYPHVPLFDGQSLAIALFSYAGQLHWGINADWDNIPDPDEFIEALKLSFAELRRAAARGGEEEVQRATTRRVEAEPSARHPRSRRLKSVPRSNMARTG